MARLILILSFLLSPSIAYSLTQMEANYLRDKVGSKVVTIFLGPKSGGTGFYAKMPSGQTLILTNAHICDMAIDGEVAVEDEGGVVPIIRKIVAISEVTDLCLVEAGSETQGIEFGADPYVGQQVYSVGHPELDPLTIGAGEFIGTAEIHAAEYYITDKDDARRCSKPKNRIESGGMLIEQKICTVVVDAAQTTVPTYPGNSGSPLVNERCELVGVVFASSNRTHKGSAVQLKDVREFVRGH